MLEVSTRGLCTRGNTIGDSRGPFTKGNTRCPLIEVTLEVTLEVTQYHSSYAAPPEKTAKDREERLESEAFGD